MTPTETYFDLIDRLSTAELNRSENDLSSNLKGVFTEQGLYGAY